MPSLFSHSSLHSIKRASCPCLDYPPAINMINMSSTFDFVLRRSKRVIMLLRTSVAAFATAISLGLWSEASNTVLAHDIYSNLRDRDGNLCCGGQDCEPVEATVLPDGSYYVPATGETIPAEMATPSPDDRFHHCIFYPLASAYDPWGGQIWESRPKTRCFFAPLHSS